MTLLLSLVAIFTKATMGDWIGAVSGLLKLANGILSAVKEQDIRADEGRKIFVRDLAILQKRLGLSDEIHDTAESLSDADLIDDATTGR